MVLEDSFADTWSTIKMNKWVKQVDQLKPEQSLEAKMLTLRPSYFGYIVRRQGSLKKTIMLGR